jgi:hypothetical protein
MSRLLRFAVMLLVAALSSSCASSNRKELKLLDETLREYASVMRWGDTAQAIAFIDPEVLKERPLSPVAVQRYAQVQIAGYREQPYQLVTPTEARQTVQVDLVNRHTQEARSVIDTQRWRYDATAKRWWLMSGLPDIAHH